MPQKWVPPESALDCSAVKCYAFVMIFSWGSGAMYAGHRKRVGWLGVEKAAGLFVTL